MPASITAPRFTPSQLLRASQSSGPTVANARGAFVERFGKLLKKISVQTCRRYHLGDQEREEVLAEAYQQLFNPEIVRFVPRRGKSDHYFKGIVQNAARKTMTQVGFRSRRGWSSIRETGLTLAAEVGGDGAVSGRLHIHGEVPLPGAEAELRDMVDYVMRKAPSQLRRALELCYWEDWSVQSIATHMGVNRHALAWDLRAFLGQMHKELEAE